MKIILRLTQKYMKKSIVGLKELRENINAYIKEIEKGKSFIVARKSKPVFKISPADEEDGWENIVDFTKIKSGGVKIKDILSRI